MNKIFKVVWSKARNAYVVVSEVAKANGKSSVKSIAVAVAAAVLMSSGTALAADTNVLQEDTVVSTGIHYHDGNGKAADAQWDLGSNELWLDNQINNSTAQHAVKATGYDFQGTEGSTLKIEAGEGKTIQYGLAFYGNVDVDNVTIKVNSNAVEALVGETEINADSINLVSANANGISATEAGSVTINSDALTITAADDGIVSNLGGSDINITVDTLNITANTANDNGAAIRADDASVNVTATTLATIKGDLVADNAGSVALTMAGEGSTLTGAATTAEGATTTLSLSDNATWNVTGDSTVTSITGTSYEIAGSGAESLVVNNDKTGSTTASNGIYSTGTASISGLDTLDVTSENRHALEVATKMEITDVGTVNLTSVNGNGAMVYGDLTIKADELNIDAQNSHGIRASADDEHSANVDIDVTDLTITATKAGETAMKVSDGAAIDVVATGTAEIKGDIEVEKDEYGNTGKVSLEINGEKSFLEGAIITADGGTTTLTMNNGATWNVTSASTVSNLAGSKGTIAVEKAEKGLVTVENNTNQDLSLSVANGGNMGVDIKEGITALKNTVVDAEGNALISDLEVGAVNLQADVEEANGKVTTTIKPGDAFVVDTDTMEVTGDVVADGVSLADTAKQVEQNKADITAMKAADTEMGNQISQNTNDIAALETKTEGIQTDLSKLNTEVQNTNAELQKTNANVSTLNSELEKTNATLDTTNTNLSKLNGELVATNKLVEENANDIAALETKTDNIQTDLSKLNTEVQNTNAELQKTNANVSALNDELVKTNEHFNAELGKTNELVVENANDIAALETTTEGIQTDLSKLNTEVENTNAALNEVASGLDAVNKEVQNTNEHFNTELGKTNKLVVENAKDIAALETTTENIQSDLSDLNTEVVNTNAELQKTNANVSALNDELVKTNEHFNTELGKTNELVVENANDIAALETTTENIQSDLSDLNTEVVNTNAELQKTNANVSTLNSELVKTNEHFNAELGKTNEQVVANATNIAANSQAIGENRQAIAGLGNRLSSLDNRVDKVGAGAAALAALHPLDYDAENKLSFAAGVGNYGGATAGAIGAFYRPNEDVMFSIGGTAGNGENMVNAGVSFAIGKGSSGVAKLSKAELVQEVNAVKAENEALKEENKDIRNELNKLKALVMELAAKK